MEQRDERRTIFGARGYLVSNRGYVVNARWPVPKLLKERHDHSNGNPVVTINGKHRMVAKLVWEAFVGSVDSRHVIRHWDGNKRNNCLENLFLCTKMEVANYSKIPVRIIDTKTGKELSFDSIRKASKKTDIIPHLIWEAHFGRANPLINGYRIMPR